MEMMTVLGICNDGLCIEVQRIAEEKDVADGGRVATQRSIDGGKIPYYTPSSSWGRRLTMCRCISTISGTSSFPMGYIRGSSDDVAALSLHDRCPPRATPAWAA